MSERHQVLPEAITPPPAFYALPPGGWRDWWTLLHPPYTAWHLSYVAIGASLAPRLDGVRLGASILGFFLGVGITAHALDELRGRPLRTRIPSAALVTAAVVALVAAVALGILGAFEVSPWMLVFVAFGSFIVGAYNLEWFGGRFHHDAWFAIAWGGFPTLTGYFAQAGTLRPSALVAALGAASLSAAQRALSTPVRRARRHAVRVSGSVAYRDGSTEILDRRMLLGPSERALELIAAAVSLLALGLVLARLLE